MLLCLLLVLLLCAVLLLLLLVLLLLFTFEARKHRRDDLTLMLEDIREATQLTINKHKPNKR